MLRVALGQAWSYQAGADLDSAIDVMTENIVFEPRRPRVSATGGEMDNDVEHRAVETRGHAGI